MAGIKGKTKKKPPPKTTARKAPRPKPLARATSIPSKTPTTKAAPAAKAAPVAKAVPVTKAVPPPLAASVIFATTPKSHVPPKPLASGAFTLDKLHQVSLTATNLDLAVEFYRDVLGLKFIARVDPPGLAFFALSGGARLLLSVAASQATLYFQVESLDTAVRELKKRGVSFLQPNPMVYRDDSGDLGKKGNEERTMFLKDPSGNLLGLVERR
jgi:catechol 2,3-dioxygenase-like lactoylglutathione lyase family enzyme